jgi:hypothetical protein
MEVVFVRVGQPLEAIRILSVGLRHMAAESNANWRFVPEEHFRLFALEEWFRNLLGELQCLWCTIRGRQALGELDVGQIKRR